MAFYEYAVTTKKTRKPVNMEAYHDYFNDLLSKNPDWQILNLNFEDTKGLHCHYMIRSSQEIKRFKQLYIHPYGWSHKMIPIYDREKWIQYVRKDVKPGELMASNISLCYKLRKAGKRVYHEEPFLYPQPEDFQQQYEDPMDEDNDSDIIVPTKSLFK